MSALFWISVLLLTMVYWLVGSLIIGGVKTDDLNSDWMKMLFRLFGTEWNGESRSGGFNLVIGLVLLLLVRLPKHVRTRKIRAPGPLPALPMGRRKSSTCPAMPCCPHRTTAIRW